MPAAADPAPPAAQDRPEVEVRRSAQRRKTVTAFREGNRIVVAIPARFSAAAERKWVDTMVARVLERELKAATRPAKAGDAELTERAASLAKRYLNDRPGPATVRWVGELRSRWASCTPVDRMIRVSDALRDVPTWVLDYVLVHELAHLLEPGHDEAFWALLANYPRTERARGYLEGLAAAGWLTAPEER